MNQSDSLSVTDADHLDPVQLDALEKRFRAWAGEPGSASRRRARARLLLIFLLIRTTGAKLREVLTLDPGSDLRQNPERVAFGARAGTAGEREIPLAQRLADEIRELLAHMGSAAARDAFRVDPAHVRRVFYQRTAECGFSPRLGGPEKIRTARAAELLSNNVPLTAVQRLLGQSSPQLTTARLAFSEQDLAALVRVYMEREAGPRTSARNRFFGKVRSLEQDVVQCLVCLETPDNGTIHALVTNASADRLRLAPGRLADAEIKAPFVLLERPDRPGLSSAENSREGVVAGLCQGPVTTECSVALPGGTTMCSVLSSEAFQRLGLTTGDAARVLFSASSVILHAE